MRAGRLSKACKLLVSNGAATDHDAAYAFLQSVGYVNDHFPGCWLRTEVGREQRAAR